MRRKRLRFWKEPDAGEHGGDERIPADLRHRERIALKQLRREGAQRVSLRVGDEQRHHVAQRIAQMLRFAAREPVENFALAHRVARQHGVAHGDALPPQRWEDVLDAINVAAGPMVGREYAARYLSAEDRRQAAWIVDKLREVQIEAVKNNSWMSAEAKTEAQAKLAALKIEIGTPLRDLDYSVQPMGRGSFGGNMLIASTWRHREEMKRIGKGNADRRWDVLPQQPSLAYDLAQNRLIVTAAILQGPVFNAKADAADKFGSFGGLVGHELTRAIDAKGALVDAKGELRSWWTPADKTAWTLLGNRVAAQYGAYDFPGVKGAKVNGTLTQEENLADIAGLELAWAAYVAQEPKAKQAQQQGFFRAWSTLWAQQLSPNEAVRRLTADIRAPGLWRSNGTLANLPAFGATFSCKAGQPMQRSEADQIKVWR